MTVVNSLYYIVFKTNMFEFYLLTFYRCKIYRVIYIFPIELYYKIY